MREIKFRAWDGRLMDYDPTIDCECGPDVVGIAHVNWGLAHNQLYKHYMQYTGLKDAKGVEIYEGDIVKDGRVYLYEVKWVTLRDSDENSGGYNVGVGFNVYPPDDDNQNVYEVIGNIYEHPELREAAS